MDSRAMDSTSPVMDHEQIEAALREAQISGVSNASSSDGVRRALHDLNTAESAAQAAQASRQQQQQQGADSSSSLARGDATTRTFFHHSTATRVNTDAVIAAALARQYPGLELVVTPAGNSNLLGYARAGFASYEEVQPPVEGGGKLPDSLAWDLYIPPARRLDGALGGLGERTLFAKYLYRWKDQDFIVYLVEGRDGAVSYGITNNYYILTPKRAQAQRLILEAGRWAADLHDEVWVFDGGYWQKSRELFESVRHASWDAVILDPAMKRSLIDDHLSFFSSRDTYARLKVPWKRGIIYHGPPGNGKTISIKAMMHTLYAQQPTPVPTLYVRSLTSVRPPIPATV
jgi:transitional endoplasmic reticulum ATPase